MSDTPGRSTPPPEHTARVVTLHGDLDLLTAPALRERLDMLTAGPCPDLVLDLRPVSFIDCAGLGVLCRVRNRVRARHGRLRLVTGSASVRRWFVVGRRTERLAPEGRLGPVTHAVLHHTRCPVAVVPHDE